MSVISESKPKARKEHQCDNCFGVIAPSDTYVKQFLSDDGEVWGYKSHELCHAIFLWCYYEHGLDEYGWCVQSALDELADWWKCFTMLTQGMTAPPKN